VLAGTAAANAHPYLIHVAVGAAGADGDGDGLTDAWEYRHFGSATSAAPEVDPDADGRSNRWEQALGSDPRARDSAPALTLDTASSPWTVRYARSRAAGAPVIQPQTGTDLAAWINLTSAVRVVSQTTEAEVVELDLPTPSGDRRFARLLLP
jgi:hypothetical protein